MSFFTESQLRGFAASAQLRNFSSTYISESVRSAQLSIFLSHSHQDRELAQGIINHLATLKITVYVDWNDSSMPRETNRETADKIKQRIAQLDLVLVLATNNALNSKWVPWEVGVADKTKGEDRILVAPVQDESGSFKGSEYLNLYRRVVIADDGHTGVFSPNQTSGDYLSNYLSQLRGRQ